MNTLPKVLLLSSILGSSAGALAATLVERPAAASAAPSQAQAVGPDAISALRADFDRLSRRLLATEEALELARAQQRAPMRESASSQGLEDLIRQLIAESQAHSPASLMAADEDSLTGTSASDLYARLQDPELSNTEIQELWQQISASGRLEEVVDFLAARALANPNDPALEVDLGAALLQRIQEVGNGPLAGVYATQADEAFNRALKLDATHWDARYHKAVALSFWPPVLGKQPAAIAEFVTLVGQQSQSTQQPEYAQTHLLLGNLYQQSGQLDKALAAWQTGAQLFPGNAALAQQLALLSQSQD